jgi:hypothetical protein
MPNGQGWIFSGRLWNRAMMIKSIVLDDSRLAAVNSNLINSFLTVYQSNW